MPYYRTALVFSMSLACLAVIATGCGTENSSAPEQQQQPSLEPRSMVAFSGCKDLVSFAQAHLRKELDWRNSIGIGGLNTSTGGSGMGPGSMGTGGTMPEPGAAMPGAGGPGPQDNTGDPDHSNTNNQTKGVDEPDLVKTDGQRMFTLSQNTLRILNINGTSASLTDTLVLGDHRRFRRGEILIHQNRILAIFSTYEYPKETVHLIEIDASAPGQAKVVARMSINGRHVSARKIGSVVRVVLRTEAKRPNWHMEYSFLDDARQALGVSTDGSQDNSEVYAWAKQKARAENEILVSKITELDLLPDYRLERDGAVIAQGPLYGCEHALRPGVESGIDMLSVLSLDLNAGITPVSGTGVMAKGSTVYASESSLYVATGHDWSFGIPTIGPGVNPSSPRGQETYIHKFDIRDPKQAVYRATGSVDGRLLNQFAMSEHKEVLRVAATRQGIGGWRPQDNIVATMKEEGKHLVEVGRVSGLGPTEQIRSVRFMGDVGYVVTFRRTDPLYTLDLTNPALPTVLGELKIEGYSAYLHPLSPGYLLGVGQDADPNSGRDRGLQLSIFDVRDLKAPKRIHNTTYEWYTSLVETDHRALLYWPKTQSLVLPVFDRMGTEPGTGSERDYFDGAMLFHVDPETGFDLRSKFRHPKQSLEKSGDQYWYSRILRSAMVNDTLWTVSQAGVMASSTQDGAQLSWLAYP